jgi:hypothetical protein
MMGAYITAGVASREDLLKEHVARHDLGICHLAALHISNYTDGKPHVNYILYNGVLYSIYIRGQVERNSEKFGIVRTMLRHGNIREEWIGFLQEYSTDKTKSQINNTIKRLVKTKEIKRESGDYR